MDWLIVWPAFLLTLVGDGGLRLNLEGVKVAKVMNCSKSREMLPSVLLLASSCAACHVGFETLIERVLLVLVRIGRPSKKKKVPECARFRHQVRMCATWTSQEMLDRSITQFTPGVNPSLHPKQ